MANSMDNLKEKYNERMRDPAVLNQISRNSPIDIYKMAYWAGVDDCMDAHINDIHTEKKENK